MPVIYLDDILEHGSNKYLAVNVAAQRARHLNEKGIPILMSNALKPVTLALQELSEGKIGYKQFDQPADNTDDFPFGALDDPDEDSAEILEELQPVQEYFDDSSMQDPDEPEEGL